MLNSAADMCHAWQISAVSVEGVEMGEVHHMRVPHPLLAEFAEWQPVHFAFPCRQSSKAALPMLFRWCCFAVSPDLLKASSRVKSTISHHMGIGGAADRQPVKRMLCVSMQHVTGISCAVLQHVGTIIHSCQACITQEK